MKTSFSKTAFILLMACLPTTVIWAQWEVRHHWQLVRGIDMVNAQVGYRVNENTIFKTTDGGETWTLLHYVKNYDTKQVDFIDENIGWVVGGGLILKTSDGGTSWEDHSPSSYISLERAVFINADEGWIAGSSGNEYGTIIHTTDGGAHWETQLDEPDKNLQSIYFLDDITGWAVGWHGAVFKTTDAGAHWESLPSNLMYDLNDVYFTSPSVGWTVESTDIFKTIDGGMSWVKQKSALGIFKAIVFVDPNTGWAMGEGFGTTGIIYHTTNGGTTWTQQILPDSKDIEAVQFIDKDRGWAVGGPGYDLASFTMRTTDGGANWIAQNSTPNPINPLGNFQGMDFSGSNTIYVVGAHGVIRKSQNGGTSWESLNSGTTHNLNGVDFVNENIGWAVGFNSKILKTADSGQSWAVQPVPNGGTKFLMSVHFADTSNGWAVGYPYWILKTTNGGTTWTQQTIGTNTNFTAVYFANLNKGWAVGEYGTIMRTTNGGSTWTEINTSFYSDLNGMFFQDENKGWAVGVVGTLLKTIDGGLTWTKIATPETKAFKSIYFSDANNGWIVGDGLILKTNDGGNTWKKVPVVFPLLNVVKVGPSGNVWILGADGLFLNNSSPTSPTEEAAFESKQITVNAFPNPSAGNILLNYPPSVLWDKIEIYNSLGQLLEVRKGDVTEINISSYKCGIYFLMFWKEGSAEIKKIVKE